MGIALWSARLPQSQEEREAVAELIGRDGSQLLADISAADAPTWLREIPAGEILRRIWIQNYVWVEGQLHWRSNDNLPPGNQANQLALCSRSTLWQKARDKVDRL